MPNNGTMVQVSAHQAQRNTRQPLPPVPELDLPPIYLKELYILDRRGAEIFLPQFLGIMRDNAT